MKRSKAPNSWEKLDEAIDFAREQWDQERWGETCEGLIDAQERMMDIWTEAKRKHLKEDR